jgi:hypothetical protein
LKYRQPEGWKGQMNVLKHSIYTYSEGKIDEELKEHYNTVLHCIKI